MRKGVIFIGNEYILTHSFHCFSQCLTVSILIKLIRTKHCALQGKIYVTATVKNRMKIDLGANILKLHHPKKKKKKRKKRKKIVSCSNQNYIDPIKRPGGFAFCERGSIYQGLFLTHIYGEYTIAKLEKNHIFVHRVMRSVHIECGDRTHTGFGSAQCDMDRF